MHYFNIFTRIWLLTIPSLQRGALLMFFEEHITKKIAISPGFIKGLKPKSFSSNRRCPVHGGGHRLLDIWKKCALPCTKSNFHLKKDTTCQWLKSFNEILNYFIYKPYLKGKKLLDVRWEPWNYSAYLEVFSW